MSLPLAPSTSLTAVSAATTPSSPGLNSGTRLKCTEPRLPRLVLGPDERAGWPNCAAAADHRDRRGRSRRGAVPLCDLQSIASCAGRADGPFCCVVHPAHGDPCRHLAAELGRGGTATTCVAWGRGRGSARAWGDRRVVISRAPVSRGGSVDWR